MSIEPGRVLSHYTLTAKIAAGGMGEVYRARDGHLPRDVAIKILPASALADEQARKRFRREAEALSHLNHPHIATIHDFDAQDGVDFLVMEYVEGTTLAGRLRDGPLPVGEILRMGSEIASALEVAHKRGVVHRDLKPGNVGLTANGQVKVLDFGLAQMLRPVSGTSTTESMAGVAGPAGTLPYMAPEHLRGTPADHRSDLYSLGVVLYEMTTGRPPFARGLASALIDDILHGVPARPTALRPDVPPGLESLILKCLEKDPGLRYQSAQEILVDLRRMTTPSLGLEAMRGLSRSRRPGPLGALVGAGVVIALAAGLVVGLNVGGWRDRLAGGGPGTKIESVVVLPSEVLATEEDAFLADAVPRTLSTYLTQVQGLDTKMPPTSIQVEGIKGDLERVAKAYDVGALVLSAITVRSDDVHLSVQLVDANSRRMVWSREYDGRRQGYLELVYEAAEGLRDAIRPAAAPVPVVVGSSEPEILFQRAMYHSTRYNNQHRSADYERALSAFEEVLRLDPRRADAAAEIALLGLFKLESGAPPEESVSHMRSWGRRALQIDPRNGRGWASLAAAEYHSNPDPLAPLRDELRAASLAPRDAYCLNIKSLGNVSTRLSVDLCHLAWRRDPLYFYPALNAAYNLGLLGRTLDGLSLAEQVLELEPDMPFALGIRSQLLLFHDRGREAAAINAQLRDLVAEDRFPQDYYQEAADLVAVDSGEPEERRRATKRLLELYKKPGWRAEPLIMMLARRGEIEAALGALRQAPTIPPYDWLMLCPALKSLRGNERYAHVLARSRAQFEKMLAIFDDARAHGEFPQSLEEPLARLLDDLKMSGPRASD